MENCTWASGNAQRACALLIFFTTDRLSSQGGHKAFDRAWRQHIASYPELDAGARQAVRSDLAQYIAHWLSLDTDQGRLACRTELMDSLERLCLERSLQVLEPATRVRLVERMPEFRPLVRNLSRQMRAEELRIAVLRDWAGRYYRDRGRDDWYETYRKATELRMESIGRDFERVAGLPVLAVENNRDAAIRGLNASLRLRLLQMPPGRAVTHRSLRTRLLDILPG